MVKHVPLALDLISNERLPQETAMLPDLLVTDFAGTTLREEGAVLVAYRAALTSEGIPFEEADLAARRGASKRAVFRELAARAYPAEAVGAVADRALATFEATLDAAWAASPAEEIPGAGAALALLKARGIRLALTSGFGRGLVDQLVARLGWGDLFDVVLAAEDAPRGRPAPYLIYQAMMATDVQDVGRVAVVGDTPLDLAAAANARAGWIIGVLSGAHGLVTLGATAHTHLLPSVAELPALFGVAP